MYRPTASLRERQAEHVRASVLDAAIAALETRDADDLSMGEIAEAAGVSLRTLYRYFPDRASLLDAAGDRLYASLGISFDIAAPEDIAASFREAAHRLASRPRLVRSLVQSRAGQATRSGVRNKRVKAIGSALRPITEALDGDLARSATLILTHLCSAASWVAVANESQVSDAEAQEAVAWAIEALLHNLREESKTASRKRQSA